MKRSLWLIIAGGLLSSTAFGLTSNCPTANGSGSISGEVAPGSGTGASGTANGPNSLTAINALAQAGESLVDGRAAITSGCGIVNSIFTNFSLTTTAFEDPPGTTNTDGVYGRFSSNVITFASVRGAVGGMSSADTQANDNDNNFSDTNDGAATLNLTYIASIASNITTHLFTNFNLTINDVVLSDTNNATRLVNLCLGVTAVTIASNFDSGACGAAGGTFLAGTSGNLAEGTNTLNISFLGSARVAVSQTIVLHGTSAGGGGLDSFSTFSNNWTETPEPSSIGFLGAGLAGIGLLVRRRRLRR